MIAGKAGQSIFFPNARNHLGTNSVYYITNPSQQFFHVQKEIQQ